MALDRNTMDPEEICTDDSVIRILSPEILFTVFQCLDVRSKGRAAQVCRTWREVIYIPGVWKNVEVHRLSPASLFDVYLSRGIHRIKSPSHLPNARLNEWLSQVDDFVSHSETPAIMISIHCSCTFNNFTADSLDTLLRAPSSSLITSIFLSESWCVSNSFFVLVAKACSNLVDLKLLKTVFEVSFDNTLDSQTVWTALGELRKLRCFAMLGWNINDAFFEYLVNNSVGRPTAAESTVIQNNVRFHAPTTSRLRLTQFHLKNCYDITNESLMYISLTMPDLIELCLEDCDGVTYEGVKCLSALKRLRKLSLPCLRPSVGGGNKRFSLTDYNGDNYNDMAIASLAKSGVLGRLETLFIVGITDKAMDVIAPHTRRR